MGVKKGSGFSTSLSPQKRGEPDFSTCFCEDIDYQTYAHVVGMKKPFKEGWDAVNVPIDVCIATEIAELWHKGVVTLNSCCGHQKSPSNVIVDEKNRKKMEKLGYTDYYLAPSGLPCVALKTGTQPNQLKQRGKYE